MIALGNSNGKEELECTPHPEDEEEHRNVDHSLLGLLNDVHCLAIDGKVVSSSLLQGIQ